MSEEPFNDKEKQFNDLWDGLTPKGVNRVKAYEVQTVHSRACSSDETPSEQGKCVQILDGRTKS